MKRPNFFVIGAPKSGTTSLIEWLRSHPDVFIPSAKEPQHFNFDFFHRKSRGIKEYENNFLSASDCHLAVGEGSTCYLYSRCAVPAILKYADRPLFIVMIRDPVAMAVSLHEQELFNGEETVSDFQLAWRLQAQRAYGARLPPLSEDPQIFQYGDRCRLGEQLERLYDHAPRDQVLVLNIDDMHVDPAKEYGKVLDFLGLDNDGRMDFPRFNAAKRRRIPALWRGARLINRTLWKIGIPRVRIGFTALLDARTREERPRPPIDPAFKSELRSYFRDDIKKLEALTNFNLASWYKH